MVKASVGEGRTSGELELAIKQVIDESIVSEGIVNVFAAAGIDSPDISILSEEFLKDMQKSEYQNVALETLRRLLNDEIKVMSRTNLVQSKTLREMLEQTMVKYQNRSITSAEALQELINLAKDLKKRKSRGEELGLTEYEVAFYDALIENESAVTKLGTDTLTELAKTVVDVVKTNATLDWTKYDTLQAKMRRAVKRVLRHAGYPPDAQKLAELRVMETAKAIAGELV